MYIYREREREGGREGERAREELFGEFAFVVVTVSVGDTGRLLMCKAGNPTKTPIRRRRQSFIDLQCAREMAIK